MKKVLLVLGIGFLGTVGYFGIKTGFNVNKMAVHAFILGGKIVSPEGSVILKHYCFGNGDTLVLDNDYIKESPVIKKAMLGMKNGQTKEVRFHQKEDWRLSYALNPFSITKTKKGYVIHQLIKFRKCDYTELNLGFKKIRVGDGMVHVYDCKPYVAICRIPA